MTSLLRRNFSSMVSGVLVTFDLAAIFLAVAVSYWLRFYSPLTRVFPVTKGIPPFAWYLYGAMFVAFVWIIIFARHGMYRSRREISIFEESYHAFQGITIGFLIVLASTFFLRGEASFSRLVLVMVWISSIFFVAGFRRLERYWELKMLKRGYGARTAIIVGQGEIARKVYRSLQRNPHSGYQILGSFSEDLNLPPLGPACPQLGRIEETSGKVSSLRPQLVIIALPAGYDAWTQNLILSYPDINVEFQLVPDFLGMIASRAEVLHLEGLPLVSVGRTPLNGWARILKRSTDIAISLITILLFSPLMLVLALIVKLTSPGPVIFSQERVSVDGRRFRLYKFRSMPTDAEKETGPVFTTDDDPRRTGIGAFMRKNNLDELQQLFNVFKGDMSLVGPRPERPHFVDKFKEEIPLYLRRHRVKSGITGWAQVNGLRGNTSIPERTKYDLYYVENWSTFLDLKIIVLTLRDFFSSKNAY